MEPQKTEIELSIIVDFAAQYIASKAKQGSKLTMKVRGEINNLSAELMNVNKLDVGDEGRRQLENSDEVRCYFKELRRIAYEAEDVVDTYLTKSSTSSSIYHRVWANLASKKVRILTEGTREVKRKLDQHAAGSSDNGVPSCARGSQAPMTHLPAHGNRVIGIDHDITKVIDLLSGKSDMLAIVGMGGSGKTTLAQSVYNNKTVRKHFFYRAWVSVSQGWDTSKVLLDIHKQIRQQKWFVRKPDNNEGQLQHEPNELASQLNKLVYKTPCLLVLDDVWDMQSLHNFITLIRGDKFVSCQYTIVITSRQSPLNRINWCIYQPQRLNDDNSWKLLSLVASNHSSKALSDDYRALAMEMLRKCQGLPLAIVALGRFLKTKKTIHEWQKVSSQIEGEEGATIYGPVKEILKFSYDELPYYLKPCFLYLGLFPERSTISGGTLIKMWIAEGFVESNNEETLEVAGRRYLQELIDHHMVQVVRKTYSGKAKTIRVHDIMRHFCISKARDLDFLAASSFGPEAIGATSRRVAINLSKDLLPADNSHLRSLSLIEKSSASEAPEGYTFQANQRYIDLVNVCRKYKLLRVLDIFGIKSPNGTLPREIGDLIHLTYLRIRSTNIRQLPKSIGKLLNLVTLDYWDVSTDSKLHVPNVLWKLKRLRHLYLPNEISGADEDLKLDTLNNLFTLWGVCGGYWMLKNMDRLSPTLSKLYIHGISTEVQLNAVLSCPAMEKNSCLYALALEWYSFEFKSLKKLLAKQNLQKLRLSGKATEMSHPQGLEFPSNLGKLELYYTQLEKPETMWLLEKLDFLKVLRLCKNSYLGSEWNCAKQAFPRLEELKLENLPNLEIWEMEEGAMPCLKTLSIVSCVNLKKMPEGLKLVQSLEKLDIEHMPHNFRCRLQKVKESRYGKGGEDFHIIKHIAQVNFRSSVTPLLY